ASSSPTFFRLAGLLRQRFPQLRWVTWEPVSDENAIAGAALLAGRPLRPTYDLGAARVILSLDADLLLSESNSLAHARGFIAGRRLASEKETMNRLWAVESAYTTTGAMADHRLALPSGQIGAFALALAQALGAPGVSGAGQVAGADPHWLATLAKDLKENAGHSLVVAGRGQPPAGPALALAVNAPLRHVRETVLLRRLTHAVPPSTAEPGKLAAP